MELDNVQHKIWENGVLRVDGRYLKAGNKPFFWLADTAWLIFTNISEEEAYTYLRNRAERGFNVIQAVLVYTTPELEDINKMKTSSYQVTDEEYWEHCDRVIRMAEELGLYMALLPTWGSLVKNNILNENNALDYANYLGKRYANYKNVIWILGGDIRAAGYEEVYRIMGRQLKKLNPDKLITFHPFGRCMSTMWFDNNDEWLDFNMFQSGHRRYDQCNMGLWDDNADNEAFYSEDNWRYVKKAYEVSDKPVLDGEPSYEWIVQGLHDNTQPYWKAIHVRRYAYWSVLAGACGHTYGDNSIMQYCGDNGGSYGACCSWQEALHHEGAAEMGYLRALMESVDFTTGSKKDELLIGGQRDKHKYIAVFAGDDFVFVYDYLGSDFSLDTRDYQGADMYWYGAVNGDYSYIGKAGTCFEAKSMKAPNDNTDRILVINQGSFTKQ